MGYQPHTNTRANRAPIFWYSTEEEESFRYAIACCFAGLQVVIFKGQSTSNCLALPEPSCFYSRRCLCHLHPFPERVHKVKLTTSCCSPFYHGSHWPAAAVSSSDDRQIINWELLQWIFFLVTWQKGPYFSLLHSPGSGALGRITSVKFTLGGSNLGSILSSKFRDDFDSGSTGMRIGDAELISVSEPFHANRFGFAVYSGVSLRPSHRRLFQYKGVLSPAHPARLPARGSGCGHQCGANTRYTRIRCSSQPGSAIGIRDQHGQRSPWWGWHRRSCPGCQRAEGGSGLPAPPGAAPGEAVLHCGHSPPRPRPSALGPLPWEPRWQRGRPPSLPPSGPSGAGRSVRDEKPAPLWFLTSLAGPR